MAFALAGLAMGVSAAAPGSRRAAIENRHMLTCGGVERPGLATFRDGTWRGREVELCRDLARRLLGPAGLFRFHGYATEADFTPLRQGDDDIAFLTRTEVDMRGLAARLSAGPVVVQLTQGLMVKADAPTRALQDLRGQGVCFIAGSLAEDALNDWLLAHHLDVERAPFSEEGEMMDAFHAGHCDAIAGETLWLAAHRAGPPHAAGRLLPTTLAGEPLAIYWPVGPTPDAAWDTIVARTLQRSHPTPDPKSE